MGDMFKDLIFTRKKGKTTINPDLKALLLEFTLNALLEQPERVIPYAKDYFDNLLEKTFGISEVESELETVFPEEGAFEPDDYRRERGKVVYSEAYNPEKDDEEEEELAYHHKNHIQNDKLLEVCRECLLFKNLDKDHMSKVIDAMFERVVKPEEYVIKQGDDGDNFYIIDRGFYDVYIDDEYVKSYENNGHFGELALMYNMPRAATVQATTDGALWALDRKTFRTIVLKGVYKKRKMYEDFLNKVPMLSELTAYERMNVADALVPRTFNRGEVIIKEGDEADGMYFVESGKVIVSMRKSGTHERKIKILEEDTYFGELALVTSQPRAATVTAGSDEVKVAFLDVDAFERLLGPCMDVMKRNIKTYEHQVHTLFSTHDIEAV